MCSLFSLRAQNSGHSEGRFWDCSLCAEDSVYPRDPICNCTAAAKNFTAAYPWETGRERETETIKQKKRVKMEKKKKKKRKKRKEKNCTALRNHNRKIKV